MRLGEVPALLTRFVRKLRGGSQPILAEADDGQLYVVKFVDNMQGPNLLFNESVGTELYRLSGLPVPCWRPLQVSKAFIDSNAGCWFESPMGRVRPTAGLCFGSSFLGGKDVQLFEILPRSFHQRVRNADDFWLAWLLDGCASHADNRQAIFRERADRTLDAVFIDQGHMFGGPKGDLRPSLKVSRYIDQQLYSVVSSGKDGQLHQLAVQVDADALWQFARALPPEWITESACSRLSECLNAIESSRSLDVLVDSKAEPVVSMAHEFPQRSANSFPRTGVQPYRDGVGSMR